MSDGLDGRQKGFIILGALLCAAAFFGALALAYVSSQSGDSDDRFGIGVDNPGCEPEEVGEESGPVVVIYEVVDSELGRRCFGTEDAFVEEAWSALASIAPEGFLAPVVSLAGFDTDGDPDIIAFAGPVDHAGQYFTVALEVDEAAADADELQLTMVHELAHVFTQTSDQFSESISSADCPQFHNSYGCFLPDSYIAEWVRQFWSDDAIAGLPADGGLDEDGGDERCLMDPAFPGAYAASHPEEDFSEAFAAYVYSLRMPAGVQPRLAFFDGFPELAQFRENAISLGLTDLGNNYDECG